jgi:hypothetical protein
MQTAECHYHLQGGPVGAYLRPRIQDQVIKGLSHEMQSVTVTYRDGRVAQLEHIYVRGSKIR